MAELKTQKNNRDILEFLHLIEHKTRKQDGLILYELFCELSREQGNMWGESMVGFGSTTITYANGKTNDWLKVGFSPRKQYLALYLMTGFRQYPELLKKLGKYKTSKACLYINKLTDVDMEILKELIKQSLAYEA